jgi:hypothetical protein
MKWLTLLPALLLAACQTVTQETLEPIKVMVTARHHQPTLPFFEDSPIDVTHTQIRINDGTT